MKSRLLLLLFILIAKTVNSQSIKTDSICINDSIPLTEVIVQGDEVIHTLNKDIIRITKKMRRGCYSTGDILNKVPGLSLNYFNNSLSYHGNSNLIVLVDSVEKNMSQIMLLHHLRYDKIEIIQHPIGKYANYDVIINLHTKEGYSGYESISNASTEIYPTDANGVGKHFSGEDIGTTFCYTKNKWNFMLGYAGNFWIGERDVYTKQLYLQNNYQEFSIPNTNGSKPNSFNGDENSGGVSVDYQFNKRNSLSVQYALEKKYDVNSVDKKSLVSDLSCSYCDTTFFNILDEDKGLRQGIGIFFRGGSGKWNYNTTFNYINRKWDVLDITKKSTGYYQNNDTHRNMEHILFQVDINRRINKVYWAFTYNHFWREYLQYLNLNGKCVDESVLRYHDFNSYLSYDLNNNFSIYISCGIKKYISNNSGIKDNYINVYAKTGLFKRISQFGWCRIDYTCNMNNPSLDQTTSYGYFTDSLMWKEGNPFLRPSLEHRLHCKINAMEFATLSFDINHSPRNICNVFDLRMQDQSKEIPNNYIISAPHNGSHTNVFTNLNLNMNNDFCLCECNLNFHYKYAEYNNYNRSAKGFGGNIQIGRHLEKSKITCYISYQWGKQHSVFPQTIQTIDTDMFSVYASKTFYKDALKLEARYIFPFGFSSMSSKYSTTTPFYERTYEQDQKGIVTNNFRIALFYRIHGGKTVRQYKREMSQER